MSYIINNSRGNIVAVVPDGTVNTTATNLALVGQGVTNYGTDQNENLVYLLENFASPVAPSRPVLGQLWYNSATGSMSAYGAANTWAGFASEAYVQAQKISPAFTGIPVAPTAASGTATTQLATTAFVTNSPIFSGTPRAPTAAQGTNSTQIASTAFVQAATGALGTMSQQNANLVTISGGTISGLFAPLPLTSGGTGSTTSDGARINLELGSMAVQNANAVSITSGNISNIGLLSLSSNITGPIISTGGTLAAVAVVPLTQGGTGANNAADARTNLGLGTGATANIGTIATQNSDNVTITGGSITGILPIAIASGGTGANTAAASRVNLSAAALGNNSDITALTGLTTPLGVVFGGTGVNNMPTNALVVGNGTSPVNSIAPGSAGNVLMSTGNTWQSQQFPDAGGTVTSITFAGGNAISITGTNPVTTASTITITNTGLTGIQGPNGAITGAVTFSGIGVLQQGNVFTFTSTGAQGPVGPIGPIGPQGPQGEPGAPASNYVLPLASVQTLGGVRFDGDSIQMNSSSQLYTPNATTARFGIVRPDNATIKFQPTSNLLFVPTATTSVNGIVRPDGSSITVNSAGVLSVPPIATATTSVNGIVRPDGSSITVNSAGVLSVPAVPAPGVPYTIVFASAIPCGGFTNGPSWNDASNFFDVFPPIGSNMSKLAGFMASLSQVYFAGDVDNNDALRTQWVVQGDRIRVWVQNTEQRAVPTGNYIAIWSK
jgi:hypothetical protein